MEETYLNSFGTIVPCQVIRIIFLGLSSSFLRVSCPTTGSNLPRRLPLFNSETCSYFIYFPIFRLNKTSFYSNILIRIVDSIQWVIIFIRIKRACANKSKISYIAGEYRVWFIFKVCENFPNKSCVYMLVIGYSKPVHLKEVQYITTVTKKKH